MEVISYLGEVDNEGRKDSKVNSFVQLDFAILNVDVPKLNDAKVGQGPGSTCAIWT